MRTQRKEEGTENSVEIGTAIGIDGLEPQSVEF